MYNFKTNFPISNELEDEIRQFSAYLNEGTVINHFYSTEENKVINKISAGTREYLYIDDLKDFAADAKIFEKILKRNCKHSVYKALKDYTGCALPWGSLTGIRPSKLAYEYLKSGGDEKNIAEYMTKTYDVSINKAKILQNIVLCQKEYLVDADKFVNFYVHIPFCTTKCAYCAFITHIVGRSKSIIEPYVECLISEIRSSMQMIENSGQKIYSIYVGGGTPTALPDSCFEKVLASLSGYNVEFTCEAGRPDTITIPKIEIMKRYGVTRVCVNPQTLNNETLQAIGRSHTAENFYECFGIVKKAGFDINVDLIAGLAGETEDIFLNSVKGVVSLAPDNITVHTLSVKNGSELKNSGKRVVNPFTESMVDSAYTYLTDRGYSPYYLYRQKNMLGNLENVGYSIPGKICVNNVTTMEETLPVVACGAGAISKRLFPGDRIERLANVRDAELYVKQFDERLEKKLNFFTKQR